MTNDAIRIETSEYGQAVEFEAPHPDGPDAEMLAVAHRMVTSHYERTRAELLAAQQQITLGAADVLTGPVRRKYASYDENGIGVGEPLSDVAYYSLGWSATGYKQVDS